MTIERAIEVLQEFIDLDKELIGDGEPESDFDKFVAERDEACKIAIEAMELQLAKKHESEAVAYRYVTPDEEVYCKGCGRRIPAGRIVKR